MPASAYKIKKLALCDLAPIAMTRGTPAHHPCTRAGTCNRRPATHRTYAHTTRRPSSQLPVAVPSSAWIRHSHYWACCASRQIGIQKQLQHQSRIRSLGISTRRQPRCRERVDRARSACEAAIIIRGLRRAAVSVCKMYARLLRFLGSILYTGAGRAFGLSRKGSSWAVRETRGRPSPRYIHMGCCWRPT